jgi:hypothetical protein
VVISIVVFCVFHSSDVLLRFFANFGPFLVAILVACTACEPLHFRYYPRSGVIRPARKSGTLPAVDNDPAPAEKGPSTEAGPMARDIENARMRQEVAERQERVSGAQAEVRDG